MNQPPMQDDLLKQYNEDQAAEERASDPFFPRWSQEEQLCPTALSAFVGIYSRNDFQQLQGVSILHRSAQTNLRSLDELLERDKLREQDGFPRKIKVGRLIKPGRGGAGKVVIVPTTVEEKFVHDQIKLLEEESASGGSGDGEEGEVVGEQPIHESGSEGAGGAGQGEGGSHEIESDAYDLGKILTEKFELPNLQDKGKKRSFTRYSYDLTDKNHGVGQLLDKKATAKKILETKICLGKVPDVNDIDTTRFLVSPEDKIFRILSREKEYESQALVFFVRDYSGSMIGKPTELVVAQHVLVYSWLLYQYSRQVETRFILHDTEAKQVPDFYTYYNSKVAGGTRVVSAYQLVNKIIEEESLYRDYNLYVFHGTDGDDWDANGKETMPELKKMLHFVNRVGVSIAESGFTSRPSNVRSYLEESGLLEKQSHLIRMDLIKDDADETRLIEGIKHLISETLAV